MVEYFGAAVGLNLPATTATIVVAIVIAKVAATVTFELAPTIVDVILLHVAFIDPIVFTAPVAFKVPIVSTAPVAFIVPVTFIFLVVAAAPFISATPIITATLFIVVAPHVISKFPITVKAPIITPIVSSPPSTSRSNITPILFAPITKTFELSLNSPTPLFDFIQSLAFSFSPPSLSIVIIIISTASRT